MVQSGSDLRSLLKLRDVSFEFMSCVVYLFMYFMIFKNIVTYSYKQNHIVI